jgi:FixJ family two-component response regulator
MAVKVFASAEEFLNANGQNKPDCLILDVRMPGMSGIELHRHLMAANRKVPVVFITAHGTDDRARAEASSDYTVAYLTKPFSEDELLDSVQAGLRMKSSTQD